MWSCFPSVMSPFWQCSFIELVHCSFFFFNRLQKCNIFALKTIGVPCVTRQCSAYLLSLEFCFVLKCIFETDVCVCYLWFRFTELYYPPPPTPPYLQQKKSMHKLIKFILQFLLIKSGFLYFQEKYFLDWKSINFINYISSPSKNYFLTV